MGVHYFKLSGDIFNIANWSNREGRRKVSCGTRILFTLLAGIVIVAQI